MLYEYLKEYRIININIINALNEDNLEEVDSLLDKKDKLIENINNIKFTKKEFKKISDEFKIMDLENMILSISNERGEHYKGEINKINKNKNANRKYVNIRENGYLEKFI